MGREGGGGGSGGSRGENGFEGWGRTGVGFSVGHLWGAGSSREMRIEASCRKGEFMLSAELSVQPATNPLPTFQSNLEGTEGEFVQERESLAQVGERSNA